jgi:hypothetical protein
VRAYLDEVLPLKVHLDLQYVVANSLRGDMAALLRTPLLPARKLAESAFGAIRDRNESSREGMHRLAASAGAVLLMVAFAAQGASGL